MTPKTTNKASAPEIGAAWRLYTGDGLMAGLARGLVPGAQVFYGAYKLAQQRPWRTRKGKNKGSSAMEENSKRTSLLNNSVFLATETATQVIDAAETHTVFSLSDLQQQAVDSQTATNNDNETRVYSFRNDKFHIRGTKPFIAVPFLILAESGASWSTTDGTETDPKVAIEAALGDVEYQLRLLPELLSRPVNDGAGGEHHVADFEIDSADLVNTLIAKLQDLEMSSLVDDGTIPEAFIGLYATANVDTLNIDQWSARQFFNRKNEF
jgi:hypothetical protein